MTKLNTMNTFNNGFNIIRNGEVITLTEKEMSEFMFLETALIGKECLETYKECADESEVPILDEMMVSEEVCHAIETNILDVAFVDIGAIEESAIKEYIKNNF